MRISDFDSAPMHWMPYQTSGPGGKIRDTELPFHHATLDAGSADQTLLFTSDLQGRVQGDLLGVALAEELEMLIELGEIPSLDGIVLVGDLYDHPDLAKLGASGDVKEVYEALGAIAPVISVLGNHDRLEEVPEGSIVLDGDVCDWQGLRVGGVGGIVGQPSRPMRRTIEDFQKLLKRVLAKRPDLLLLHQGPTGVESGQRGLDEIAEVLPRGRKGLAVFGHCHWATPMCMLGELQCLNVDARVVIATTPK